MLLNCAELARTSHVGGLFGQQCRLPFTEADCFPFFPSHSTLLRKWLNRLCKFWWYCKIVTAPVSCHSVPVHNSQPGQLPPPPPALIPLLPECQCVTRGKLIWSSELWSSQIPGFSVREDKPIASPPVQGMLESRLLSESKGRMTQCGLLTSLQTHYWTAGGVRALSVKRAV